MGHFLWLGNLPPWAPWWFLHDLLTRVLGPIAVAGTRKALGDSSARVKFHTAADVEAAGKVLRQFFDLQGLGVQVDEWWQRGQPAQAVVKDLPLLALAGCAVQTDNASMEPDLLPPPRRQRRADHGENEAEGFCLPGCVPEEAEEEDPGGVKKKESRSFTAAEAAWKEASDHSSVKDLLQVAKQAECERIAFQENVMRELERIREELESRLQHAEASLQQQLLTFFSDHSVAKEEAHEQCAKGQLSLQGELQALQKGAAGLQKELRGLAGALEKDLASVRCQLETGAQFQADTRKVLEKGRADLQEGLQKLQGSLREELKLALAATGSQLEAKISHLTGLGSHSRQGAESSSALVSHGDVAPAREGPLAQLGEGAMLSISAEAHGSISRYLANRQHLRHAVVTGVARHLTGRDPANFTVSPLS